MANRSHHFLHSTPEMSNTHDVNGYFTNHTYQKIGKRGHIYKTTHTGQMNTSYELQGFYHISVHNPNITTNPLESIPFGQARGTIY